MSAKKDVTDITWKQTYVHTHADAHTRVHTYIDRGNIAYGTQLQYEMK